MNNIEEDSLTEALSYAKLNCLPNEWEERGGVWTKAVVHVLKVNTTKNYAIAVNDGTGNPSIVKDFGSTSRIVLVDKIYPFYYLDSSYQPDLRNKADIINYLSNNGFQESDIKQLLSNKRKDGQEKTDDEKKSDREIVKKYVIKISVKNQLADIELREMNRK